MKTTATPGVHDVRPLLTKLPGVEPGTLYFCRHCSNEYSSDDNPQVCNTIIQKDRALQKLIQDQSALLSALKETLRALDEEAGGTERWFFHVRNNARAAIAQAEGGK